MSSWRCNCPICRLLVHPVLRRFERRRPPPEETKEEEGGGGEASAERYAPLAAPLGQEETSAPLQPQVQVPQPAISEEALENLAVKIAEGVREAIEAGNKVLIERIDQIEENMGRLRKELQSLTDSLQNIVVELKDAISELSNPLSPLRGGVVSQGIMGINGGRRSRLVELIHSLKRLVDELGPEAIESIIREYSSAGILSEADARKMLVLTSTLARLKGKKIRVEEVLAPILEYLESSGG